MSIVLVSPKYQVVIPKVVREALNLQAMLALSAAKLSADLRLPMAGSVTLATARAEGASLWTQDARFRDFEGVRYTPA